MSIQLYKVIHLVGVMMVFLGYGGLIVRGFLDRDNKGLRVLGAVTSGVGLLLLLLGGFGMVARYGGAISYLDGWLIAKYVIWLILGAAIAIINRKPKLGMPAWWAILILGAAAAYLGIMKP
ncbi:hypothetical protein H5P28_11390 [Ruficoccus amylovorans]|uniref:Invasion protein n=1 Tax=Ruficoccus amylovorans TaxID=1804625 RepID=A0A842HEB7_9BACT|nr:hypothetical protein [Ruficoccus amylovorans]MBC2594863.1 hypothetical protein [Ruficoccus amylovorans]